VDKYGTARQVTDDNTLWRMRFTCLATKASDTLRICNNYLFSVVALVTRTRLSVTVHLHVH
jgi:hypothetical protein